MSKTPTKCNLKDVTSPTKDSGISKTIYNHILNVRSLLNTWASLTNKGVHLCKSISSLKLHEYDNDYYPRQLSSLIESLSESLDGLENVVEGVEIINLQMQALSKLQSNDEPTINTWSVNEISKNIDNIYDKLQKELRVKRIVTENIAHCRDENLMEVYVSSWEFPVYFSTDAYAYLYAEVGFS